MSRIIIYPYKMGSQSSKQLRDRLGALRVYPDRNYRYRDGDLVINWGNSHIPNWDNDNVKWLNKPTAVGVASNKLATLEYLNEAGIQIPRFFTDRIEAIDNLGYDNFIIARHKLNGHSGEGIEIIYTNSSTPVPVAPLYTKYIPAKAEYRVHIFDGNVIDIAKKVRISSESDDLIEYYLDEPTEEEMMIKSHRNGWTFARGGIQFDLELCRIAIKAINAVGLDFGAVDIIKGEDDRYYVLEVNSACGMADFTEKSYVNAIINYIIKNE